jgi:hypothetical protein
MRLSVVRSKNCSNKKRTLKYAEKQKTEKKELRRLRSCAPT